MFYKDFRRNHVVLPGREKALEKFLRQESMGKQHKWQHRCNPNSEDALTWSCFDLLSNLKPQQKLVALSEIFEDAYQGTRNQVFEDSGHEDEKIGIYIGKQYTGASTDESTEVDASIEAPDKLVFIEAKLYSSVSLAEPPDRPHDQIARKLRIGLDSPLGGRRDFFFIFLDIAPFDKFDRNRSMEDVLAPRKRGLKDKWKSAWFYNHYKHGDENGHRSLREALEGIDSPPEQVVADNMGWLTWADLFKTTLRATVTQ